MEQSNDQYVVKPHFPKTLIGFREAGEYLTKLDKFKDFWFPPSSHDIVDYANRIWNNLNENK